MSVIGRISELWRYPVKSMGGESLSHADIGPRGIPGDRGWAVRDEKAGEIRGAKKLPELLRCAARYLQEPSATVTPPAEITFTDATTMRTDDPQIAARLTAVLGKSVTLWPLQPATATDHYRRASPDNPDILAELREIFGRTTDEPLPDLSVFPPEIMEYTSPLGTYFDAFPLHLLTTASLASLARQTPDSRFDARRFRPNLLIEPTGANGQFPEVDWCGKTLRVGSVRIKVEIPCVRCVMPTLPQADLPKDPAVLRTVVRDAGQNLGVYATVVAPGRVEIGAEVQLEDNP